MSCHHQTKKARVEKILDRNLLSAETYPCRLSLQILHPQQNSSYLVWSYSAIGLLVIFSNNMAKKVVVDVVDANDIEVVSVEGPSHFSFRIAKMPRTVRFSLVILSSLVLSSGLLTVFSLQTAGHLAGISKHLEEWWEIVGLILWRATELGLAWVFGFDSAFCLSSDTVNTGTLVADKQLHTHRLGCS